MIAPALALVGWTFVLWFWMYATRIPALRKARVDMAELSRTGAPLARWARCCCWRCSRGRPQRCCEFIGLGPGRCDAG
jgi:hypothetical protein